MFPSHDPDVANHSRFSLGRVAVSGTDYFNGKIAILKIYDAVLTENQIESSYNSLRGRFSLPALTPTPHSSSFTPSTTST